MTHRSARTDRKVRARPVRSRGTLVAAEDGARQSALAYCNAPPVVETVRAEVGRLPPGDARDRCERHCSHEPADATAFLQVCEHLAEAPGPRRFRWRIYW